MKTDMNDDFLRKGVRELKDIALSPEEKKAVFARLLEHVEAHPAPTPSREVVVSKWVIRSPFSSVSGFRFEYAVAGVLFALFTGSSAVSAAEGALPGDILYPVKIKVSEPLRGALKMDDVSKAEWEAEKTERRLEEAETLAAQGRLDPASIQTVKENFERSASGFSAIVQSLEERERLEDIVNADIDFEARISAHEQILSVIEHSVATSQRGGIAPLRDAVKESVRKARERRETVTEIFLKDSESEGGEEEGDEQAAGRGDRESRSGRSFDEKAQSVQTIIDDTHERLRAVVATSTAATDGSVQDGILENVPQALQAAEDALKEAKQRRDSGDSREAFSALLDSESAAKQAGVSVKQGLRFGKEEEDSRKLGGRRGSGSTDRSDDDSSGKDSESDD